MADNSAGQSTGGTPRNELNAASGMASDVAGAVRAHPLAAGAAALAAGGLAIAALVQGKKSRAEAKSPARTAAPARKRQPETVAADTEKPRKTAAKTGAAKKSTAKKSTAKSAGEGAAKPRKTAAKSAAADDSGKPRGGLAQPVKPDEMLAAVVGDKAAPRSEMTKRLWDYIKKNNLQDASNRRMINADDKLRPIFGADQVSMFEMTKLVNKHMAAE
ncbi:MAG TPA: SWIB/MDM2 domain-containing protein [Longimicrobium sp.]|nr:SWIB/MDM2 domain-containing protein [Longimicrobium sp.]